MSAANSVSTRLQDDFVGSPIRSASSSSDVLFRTAVLNALSDGRPCTSARNLPHVSPLPGRYKSNKSKP